jgi:dGTPase
MTRQPLLDPDKWQRRSLKTLEETERQVLAAYACLSRGTHQDRRHPEPEHQYRTAFQRDRDRIIHSRAFRRLKHKRQVFLTSGGDHYRTRITHTLEVSQLSRTMSRALGLNEDLTEAIALGHDVGHTPFGHLGEVILNDIMTGKKQFTGCKHSHDFGGFKHNYHSLRILDHLENKYVFKGLNLTAPVREGILKHTGLRRGRLNFPDFDYEGMHYEQDMATTLEGQVVAICDEIAQRTHDLEDGLRAGLVEVAQIREIDIIRTIDAGHRLAELALQHPFVYIGLLFKELINLLVDDVVSTSLKNIRNYYAAKKHLIPFDEELVKFSAETDPLQKQLNKFIYKEIIDYSRVQWSDEIGRTLLFRLFETYFRYPELLPDYALDRHNSQNPHAIVAKPLAERQGDARFLRLICDYIAGMSDQYAVKEATRLTAMNKLKSDDLNLKSALG